MMGRRWLWTVSRTWVRIPNMSKNAWLTPASISSPSFVCYQVVCPDDDTMRAALRGALYLLENSYNWEQYGTMTEDEAALLWQQANTQTFLMAVCERDGDELPTGTIQLFAGGTPPTGWLLCNGATLDTTTYAALFAVIGYAFGGSGSDFLLPDMRNNFVVGAGDSYSVGDTGGENEVALTVAQLASHDHPTYPQTFVVVQAGTGKNVWGSSGQPNGYTDFTGGDEAHENRPPFVALNYIIKV